MELRRENSLPQLQLAYCAAKAAVQGFTDSLRSEWIHDGSRVHITMAQMPGLHTPQFEWGRSKMPQRARPVAPVYQPEVAARAIVWSARHEERGLGVHFKHPARHGLGFHAIDHNARPRLHPKSDDILGPGMIFNLEPAVYFDADCGLRHCDRVAVTADGHEVLTPFQASVDQLILR